MFLQDSVLQGTVSTAVVSKFGQSSTCFPVTRSTHSLPLVLFPPPQAAVHGEKSSHSAQFPGPKSNKDNYICRKYHDFQK
jgi:hypothetical protein